MCSLVVASLTTGQCLRAEDAPTPAQKEKEIAVKVGNSTATVKVQESDPYKNMHVPPPTDKYDPTHYSLNQTSSMANKSFAATSDSMANKHANLGHDSYAAKTYGQVNATDTRNTNTKYSTSASNNDVHGDSDFNKNYNTPTSSMGKSQSTGFSSTSRDQDRTSSFSGQKSNTYAANLSKQYVGPGAQHVPDGEVKENRVIAHMSDIPNRPLTIDEVRGLINHGFKPDTAVAPDAPSKAINDPDYKQEASPEPPEAPHIHPPLIEDDRDAPLPSPGTMSQSAPENSDPLPQH